MKSVVATPSGFPPTNAKARAEAGFRASSTVHRYFSETVYFCFIRAKKASAPWLISSGVRSLLWVARLQL
jgi:hypothetical protein